MKILITAPVHPVLIDTFKAAGYEVLYEPSIDYAGMVALLPEVTGLVVTTRLRIDKNAIEAAPALKWIGRLGSGLELIDTAYAQSKNIYCISTPEGNCGAVGEHTLGLLLSLLHKIHSSAIEVKAGKWIRGANRGTELSGKTVGIVGLGHTGTAFANVLRGFNVNVLAYDKYRENYGTDFIKESTHEEIQEKADLISFHLPLTSETAHLINANYLNQLKQKPIILNASRGGICNYEDLLQSLENGTIGGAGLDVLENENLQTLTPAQTATLNGLLQLPQVIITPHIAGYSHEAYLRMSTTLIDKLRQASLL